MSRRRAVAAGLAAAALLAACASDAEDPRIAQMRHVNQQFLDAEGATLVAAHPGEVLVVQNGALAAHAALADDALRAAAEADPGAVHRFVLRPEDPGPRLCRMTFLPEGGRVAGRRVFEALGLRARLIPGTGVLFGPPDRPTAFGGSEDGRVEIEVRPLDGSAVETLDVPVDPDFDGGLLLDRGTAARLGLERHEIPGRAEVQVVLSRPFDARRALVLVRVPQADASGVVEALVETPPLVPAR